MVLSRWSPIVSTIALTGTLFGCSADEPAPEPVIRPVRYVQVFSTGGQRTRSFSGVARAGVESTLSFRVAGTIERVAVKVGDRVRRGQLIARLDPIDYEIQVKEAEASLRQADAQARNASADLQRVRALYENSNASVDDLDAARAGADSAEAQVESTAKRLDLARRQVTFTRLTAPVAGAVAEVDVEVNENVRAGDPVIMLTSGQRPEVELAIPEGLITQIEAGGSVTVTFDAVPDREFAAVISEVGVATTGTATTFPVIVRLDDGDAAIRQGMASEVTFEFTGDGAGPRYLVPSEAVAEDREGRLVFVVAPGADGLGTTHRRAVTVGELRTEGLEVLDGLSDGEFVVTGGVSRLEDGQTVRVPPLPES